MRSWVCAAVVVIAACGGKDDAESPPTPATPVATEPEPIERTADIELAAIDGLRPSAAPGQSLQALDGVAPFAATEAAPECASYSKAVAGWFNEFPGEFAKLEERFSPDARGAAAMREFAGFLRRGAAALEEVTVDGEALARAHAQFVAALLDLAGGFEQLADGLEAKQEQVIAEAGQRVNNAVGNFRTSLDELVALCGA